MKVLVFGASGYIGSAVIAELRDHGHEVIAQTTRAETAEALNAAGYQTLTATMQEPDGWMEQALNSDVIIQLADSFDSNADKYERQMFAALEKALKTAKIQKRVIYTGGCWLYGNTGDENVGEGHKFTPPKAFSYVVKMRKKLLKSEHIDVIIIHPAMVWDREGGALSSMLEAARTGKPVQVVKSPDIRWPLVHRDDVATLYRLATERGTPGRDYHGVAGDAVTVGDLARAVGRRMAYAPTFDVASEDEIVAQMGEWARGFGLDQQMNARRTMMELGWRPVHGDILSHLSPYGPR